MDHQRMWREELPEQCPPNNAFPPQVDSTFFRLISEIPAKESDFDSHRKLSPEKPFNTSECIARSLSIIDTKANAELLRKSAYLKDKKLAEVKMNSSSGLILKNGKAAGHHSWWIPSSRSPLDLIVSHYA